PARRSEGARARGRAARGRRAQPNTDVHRRDHRLRRDGLARAASGRGQAAAAARTRGRVRRTGRDDIRARATEPGGARCLHGLRARRAAADRGSAREPGAARGASPARDRSRPTGPRRRSGRQRDSAGGVSGAPEWEDPRRVMRRHGLAPKRAFSQNFLVARSAVERIVEALAPRSDELTVELGPGLGTLTSALLRAGARVLAVERDRDMLAVLRDELGAVPELSLVEGDATTVDLTAIAHEHGPIALVGNLPYAVTGAIFRNLTDHRAAVSRAVVRVQREVRDRLLA